MQHWEHLSKTEGSESCGLDLLTRSAISEVNDNVTRRNNLSRTDAYRPNPASTAVTKSQSSLLRRVEAPRTAHRSKRFAAKIWTRLAKSISFYSTSRSSWQQDQPSTVKPTFCQSNRFSLRLAPSSRSEIFTNSNDLRTPQFDQAAMSASFHSHYLSFASTDLDSTDPPTYETITTSAYEAASTYEPLPVRHGSVADESELERENAQVSASPRRLKLNMSHYQSKTLDRKSRRGRKIDHLFTWLNRRFHSGNLHQPNSVWQPDTKFDRSESICGDQNGNQPGLRDRNSNRDGDDVAHGRPPLVLRSHSCVEPRPKAAANSGSKLKLLFCVPQGPMYESLAYGGHESNVDVPPSVDCDAEMGIYATIGVPRCVTFTPSQRAAHSLRVDAEDERATVSLASAGNPSCTRKLPDLPVEQPRDTSECGPVKTTEISPSLSELISDCNNALICDDLEPYGELDMCELEACFQSQLNAPASPSASASASATPPADSRPASLIVERNGLGAGDRLLMAFGETSQVSASSRSSSSGRFSATTSPNSPEPLADDITLPSGRHLYVQTQTQQQQGGVYSTISRAQCAVKQIADQCDEMTRLSRSKGTPPPPPLPRRLYRDDELSGCGLPYSSELQRDELARSATERIYESLSNLNGDESNTLKQRDEPLALAGTVTLQKSLSVSSGHLEAEGMSSDEDDSALPSRCRSQRRERSIPASLRNPGLRQESSAAARRIDVQGGCVMLDDFEQLRHIDSDAESVQSIDGCLSTSQGSYAMRNVSLVGKNFSSQASRFRQVIVRHGATPPRINASVSQTAAL